MPTYCVAYNCKNYIDKKSGLSAHKFPKDPELRQRWIIATKRKGFNPSSTSCLCSVHFEESAFETGGLRRMLKKDAVPMLFQFPPHLMKEQLERRRIINRITPHVLLIKRRLPTFSPTKVALRRKMIDIQESQGEVAEPLQFEYVDVDWETSGDVEDDADNPHADEADVFISEDTEDNTHSENDNSRFDQAQSFPKSESHISRPMQGKKRKMMNVPQNLPLSVEHNFDSSSGFQTGERETEFDVWAKSVAMQLNAMEVTRALELQLKIQTVLVEERIAHERCKFE